MPVAGPPFWAEICATASVAAMRTFTGVMVRSIAPTMTELPCASVPTWAYPLPCRAPGILTLAPNAVISGGPPGLRSSRTRARSIDTTPRSTANPRSTST